MRALQLTLLVLATLTLAGCEIIGNIFQAGIWVGAVLVILVLAGVAWVAAKLRR